MEFYRYLVVLAISALSVAARQGQFGDVKPDPLEVRLADLPLDFDKTPLSVVLDRVGFAAGGNFVMFGAEVETKNGNEPLISGRIEGGATVRQALTQVMAGVPGYSFDAVSPRLINVFPTKALSDRSDLLNLQVAGLRLDNVSPTNFLGNPMRYIPELKLAVMGGNGCAIGHGLYDKLPGLTADLDGLTIWEDFNLVSELSIAAAEAGQGPAYGWLYLHEQLPSTTHPEHRWGALGLWTPAKKRTAP